MITTAHVSVRAKRLTTFREESLTSLLSFLSSLTNIGFERLESSVSLGGKMISLVVVRTGEESSLMLGSWESEIEVEFESGSGEHCIAFKAYEEDNPQARVFSAITEDWSDNSLGRELEKLLQCAFDLGRQVERKNQSKN